jgi:hypothetical protein
VTNSSTSPLQFLRADPSELGLVRALWRANPVGGAVPYYYDAPPTSKPGYQLFLIRWEGRPVGTFSLCREALGDRTALYVSDVVLERSVRGRRLADRAIRRHLAESGDPGVDFFTAVQPDDNDDARSMLVAKRLRLCFSTSFQMAYLPALTARVPETSRDFEQICEVVNAFHAEHALFHPLTPQTLAARGDFEVHVERERGRIVACVGVWRQQRLRRLMLVRPGFALRAALRATALFNRELDAVASGDAVELVAPPLTEPSFRPGRERDFVRLLDTLAFRRDAHGFQLAFHAASPIAPLVRRRLRFPFRSRFCVFQWERQSAPLPPVEGPVYHDYSLV